MLEDAAGDWRKVLNVTFFVGKILRYPTAHQDTAEQGKQQSNDLRSSKTFYRTQAK